MSGLRVAVVGAGYFAGFHQRTRRGLEEVELVADRQRHFREMERLVVHETAIHLIDTLRALLGEVTAGQARLRRPNDAIRSEDAGRIRLDTASEAWAVINGNRHVDDATDHPRRTLGGPLREGSEGTSRLDGRGQLWRRGHGAGHEQLHDYAWDDHEFGGDCVCRLQRALMAHLLTGTPMANRAPASLDNLAVEDAIYRAHPLGHTLELKHGKLPRGELEQEELERGELAPIAPGWSGRR